MKTCIICSKELYGTQQKYCSNTCKQRDHYNRIKDQPNTYHAQTIRGFKRKIYFVNLLGGKCEICGYNKNLSVFNFHHKNPNEKKFRLDMRSMSNKSFESLETEIKKCSLLCSNCHAELHNPELNILNVNSILENNEYSYKLKTNKRFTKYCKCGVEILYDSKKCIDCENKSRMKENKPTIDQLKKDLKNNTQTKIAQKYNVSRATIKRWLK
jgi:hypothetical protein